MNNLTKQTVFAFTLNPMYNVYQFKALDTVVANAIRMQEQLDNTVTGSSWSSSQSLDHTSKVTEAWPWTCIHNCCVVLSCPHQNINCDPGSTVARNMPEMGPEPLPAFYNLCYFTLDTESLLHFYYVSMYMI